MDTNRHNDPHQDDDLQVSPKLLVAFGQLQSKRVFVPPSVDGAVLKAAHQHLGKPQKAGWCDLRRWIFWPALATACVLLTMLTHMFVKQSDKQDLARHDLNRDGRVDILDAFQLARDLQSGAKVSLDLDLNTDGVVDRRDAEAIAAHAVKLEKGGRS